MKKLFLLLFLVLASTCMSAVSDDEYNTPYIGENYNYLYEKKSINNNKKIVLWNLVFGIFSEVVDMSKWLRFPLFFILNSFVIQDYEDKKKNNKDSMIYYEPQGTLKSLCLGAITYFGGSRITDFMKSYLMYYKNELHMRGMRRYN